MKIDAVIIAFLHCVFASLFVVGERGDETKNSTIQPQPEDDNGTSLNRGSLDSRNVVDSCASETSKANIRIASFSLKQFGMRKAKKQNVLHVVAKIIIRYDLIVLQELNDLRSKVIKMLITEVNAISKYPYDYIMSRRVGKRKRRENYAIIFRPDTFQIKRNVLYDDVGKQFNKVPHMTEVLLNVDGEAFGIISAHVFPKKALAEINALTSVYEWMQNNWFLQNVIILGNLNADCDYLHKEDLSHVKLLNNTNKFNWLIKNGMDTTVGSRNCAYDRIIISGPYFSKYVDVNSSSVFRYDKEFKVDPKLIKNISDHYPVETTLLVQTRRNCMAQRMHSGVSGKHVLSGFEPFYGIFLLASLLYFTIEAY